MPKIDSYTEDTTPDLDAWVYLLNAAGTADAKAKVGNLLESFVYVSTFVPVFTQSVTLTVTSLISRYMKLGKMCHWYGWAQFTSAGTTGNGIGMTLPFTAQANGGAVGGHFSLGTGMIEDAGSTTYRCMAIADGPGVVFYNTDGTNGSARVGAAGGPQFAVASGDRIWWNVTYETT